MSTIHFKQATTATPEQFIAGLTDFGPGREKIFGNSTDQYLKVHKTGTSYADVTEGSGGIWERLSYNWSDPTHIVLTTTDSNLWGGRSGHTYTLTRQPNGTTDVDVVIVRDGKNLKGRLLGTFLGIVGKGQLEKWFAKTLKAIKHGTTRSARQQKPKQSRRPRFNCSQLSMSVAVVGLRSPQHSRGEITMHPLRKLRESGKPTAAQVSELLAENVVFNSPILIRPIEGREVVATIFAQSSSTRGSGTYIAEFKLDDHTTFLRWVGTMDGHKLESWEVIVDNEQGLIVERTIAMRPYPALKLFRDGMYAALKDKLPPDVWDYPRP